MPDILTQWPSGIRDTTEFPSIDIQIGVSIREHLRAFCNMEGVGWNDYDRQGEAGGLANVANSRLRTYRKMYERLGLIYKQDDIIRLSKLGLDLQSLEGKLNSRKEELLNDLRKTAVEILARYQLKNPIDGADLPTSCDVHPYLCIWKAMRSLGNKINYEEMNRVILRVLSMAELEPAINRIKAAREQYGDYTSAAPEILDTVLGEPVHTDQPTARIAPWFSFAGWGGLIIEQQLADGYRMLVPSAIPFVDEAIAHPPVFFETDDKDEWLAYYIGSASITEENEDTNDTSRIGEEDQSPDESSRLTTGCNVLLYGVPGSGKSWTIAHEYCTADSVVDRLVFHPDYTYADFVGQILPDVDDEKQVTYRFTPGPFTTILANAYRDPTHEYILIIEEINRGNAPAIFGEVFQLLDRKVTGGGDDIYPIGTSEYGITHKYMAEEIYGDCTHKVRIPSNLSIIGTMNTSDQNVFTLDTAFQRRWRMRLIENSFENVRDSLAQAQILDTGVTWELFCTTINKLIVGSKSKMASAEDKRLGVYFVHESDLVYDSGADTTEDNLLSEYNTLLKVERCGALNGTQKERLKTIRRALVQNRIFPEKVIKYLWDDAFRFDLVSVFETGSFESLEEVIKRFVFSKGKDRFSVFNQSVRESLNLM